MAEYLDKAELAADLRVCRTLLDDLNTQLRFGNLQRDEARAAVLSTLSVCREVLDR